MRKLGLPLPNSNDPGELRRVLAAWAEKLSRLELGSTGEAVASTTIIAPPKDDPANSSEDQPTSDDYLYPSDKVFYKNRWDGIGLEVTDLRSAADRAGVSRAAFDTAYDNLGKYLTDTTGHIYEYPLGTGKYWKVAGWNVLDGNKLFLGTKGRKNWEAKWGAYDAAAAALRAAINNKALDPGLPKDTFRPYLFWNLAKNDDRQWATAEGTSGNQSTGTADYETSRKFTSSSATGPQVSISSGVETFPLPFLGREAPIIMARLRLVQGTWKGRAKFTTSDWNSHSWSDFYCKDVAAPKVGDWAIVAWDMRSLTAGADDYTMSTVTGLRLDLGASNTTIVDIDWIAVGTYGAGSQVDYDNLRNELIYGFLSGGNATFFQNLVIANTTNLIPNANSEQKVGSLPGQLASGAIGAAGLQNPDSGNAFKGNGYRRVSGNGATVETYITVKTGAHAGDSYVFQAQAKRSGGAGYARLRLEAFDEAGTSLGDFLDVATSSSTYGLLQGTGTCPANTSSIRAKIVANLVPGGQYAYFDDLLLRKAVDSYMIVDGALLARHASVDFAEAWAVRVGPWYRFLSKTQANGGTPLKFMSDGFFARPTTGESANPDDATWYSDPTRIYPGLPNVSVRYGCYFSNGTGNRSIVVGLADPFATTAQSGYELRRDPTNARFGLFTVSGVNNYGASPLDGHDSGGTPFTGWKNYTNPGTALERTEVKVYNPSSPTSSSRRIEVLFDGAVQAYWTHGDLSSPGTISGYAAIRISDTTVRAGMFAFGPGNVMIEGGHVTADMLEADLAIVSVVRSPNYVAGSTGNAPTGFKVAGTAFTSTLKSGQTFSAQAEFGENINIAGYKAAAITAGAFGGSTEWDTAGTYTYDFPDPGAGIPGGVNRFTATVQGGGGGGGGGNNGGGVQAAGGGGGAGAYVKQDIVIPSNANKIRFIVGAGGAGGSGANGSDGGDTTIEYSTNGGGSWTLLARAKGGKGGKRPTGAGQKGDGGDGGDAFHEPTGLGRSGYSRASTGRIIGDARPTGGEQSGDGANWYSSGSPEYPGIQAQLCFGPRSGWTIAGGSGGGGTPEGTDTAWYSGSGLGFGPYQKAGTQMHAVNSGSCGGAGACSPYGFGGYGGGKTQATMAGETPTTYASSSQSPNFGCGGGGGASDGSGSYAGGTGTKGYILLEW